MGGIFIFGRISGKKTENSLLPNLFWAPAITFENKKNAGQKFFALCLSYYKCDNY
jgi:hypothetical protein